MCNVHILLQTIVLHHRNTIATTTARVSVARTVAVVTEIILSDATIGITTIEIKANEHLSAATTLVGINAIYFCVVTN